MSLEFKISITLSPQEKEEFSNLFEETEGFATYQLQEITPYLQTHKNWSQLKVCRFLTWFIINGLTPTNIHLKTPSGELTEILPYILSELVQETWDNKQKEINSNI